MRIAVLGCGLMGSGIASLLAAAGHEVVVFDAVPEAAAATAARLPVAVADDAETAARGADLIVEAVAEDLDLKRSLFARISAANPTAVIASNTSSILPSALADAVASPERFVIAHFFNPPTVVPLVEIVPAPTTSDGTMDIVMTVLREAGKLPVRLGKEAAGFVANRLQAALLREAFSLVDQGVASFADVDLIVRAGLGSRWAAAGPFTISDLGGLDIWTAVCARLFPELAVDRDAPLALVERAAAGELGAKTGRGIFDETDTDRLDAIRTRIAAHFDLEFLAQGASDKP